MDYDVIFIGSGHANNHGARLLAAAGKKVAMIEADKIGGVCTNYGCDAKILLDGPFEYLDGLLNYQDLGLKADVQIDWTKLMAHKRQTLAGFQVASAAMFKELGVDIIRGRGSIEDAHTVAVGDQKFSAEYIVIGTGARNAKLDIPGKELTNGSTEFLDLDVLPDHMIVIGAGIIGMEFASMALLAGKKVTFFEYADRPLLAYPEKYVKKIVDKFKSQGAVFHFNQAVSSVEEVDGGLRVSSKDGISAVGDFVLDATGRVANIENIGLEELGIEASRRGIKVDSYMRTAVPNIYASGDVVDKTIPKLTPTAEFESNYIGRDILNPEGPEIDYPVVPNLVFTLPRIGQVGVTIDEAAAKSEQYKLVEIPWGKLNDWVNNHELDSGLTLIFDRENYLVGAAAISSQVGSWLDWLTPIIEKKMTAKDLNSMIMSFPTQTYMLWATLTPLLKSE
ncbi:dihydrolipoyl dehydrogenase family protein [Streptococcus tangpeifui]|uniref:dihydrolipoyl dehydrogenase family protein n=1 Tax=Streptococcus tangpeifui TaxID=2709400 RepID=UPI0013ECA07D|nr:MULTISPECIES: NAD(P)/FAD-dependent oxidoreductase [unclassified Streptococcus]